MLMVCDHLSSAALRRYYHLLNPGVIRRTGSNPGFPSL